MKTCPKCQILHERSGSFCSRTCANSRGPVSEERKESLRSLYLNDPKALERSKAAGSKGGKANSPKQRKPRLPLITYTCPHCQATFTSRQKRVYCSRPCGQAYGAIGGLQPNSTKVHRTMYQGYQMDSGAELVFAKLLDQHNIKWQKNSTQSFPFVDSQGKNRLYYPDFYLPDYNHWVEIKGKRYIREDDNLRLQAVGNIELIMSGDIKLPEVCAHDENRTRLAFTHR